VVFQILMFYVILGQINLWSSSESKRQTCFKERSVSNVISGLDFDLFFLTLFPIQTFSVGDEFTRIEILFLVWITCKFS
jgi:hypothetical protein